MANDVHMIIIAGRCNGQFWECVQHFEANVASAADPVVGSNNLIAGFKTTVEADMLEMLSEDCEVIGYKAKRVNNGGGPTVMVPQAAATGQVGAQSLPSSMGYCFVQRYSQMGKWRTGRMFVPGIPESFSDGNEYTTTAITLAAAFLTLMLSFSNGGINYTWGTWAGKTNTFFPPAYAALTQKMGVQRRRLLPLI